MPDDPERPRADEPSPAAAESESLPDARPAVPPLACMRYSPRPCVNQDLVDALRPLREWRFAEYGCKHSDTPTGPPPDSYPPLTASSPEGISYSTAISAIIACPYKLRSGEEARALHKVCSAVPFISTRILIIPFGQVGEKLAIKVDEFLNTGQIREAGEQVALRRLRSASHSLCVSRQTTWRTTTGTKPSSLL